MDQTPKRVSEVSTSFLENRVEELTILMHQFFIGNQQEVKSRGIYSNVSHTTDMCPTLHEEPFQQASVVGVFPVLAQCKYDLYVNSYNHG